MKKSHLLFACLLSISLATSAQELCSYTAKISAKDKVSSTGMSLVNSSTRDTLVLMIQQDRANFHKFNRRDAEDREDCKFSSPEERAKIKLPSRSLKINPELIQKMISQEMVVTVTVLENGLEIVEAMALQSGATQKPDVKPLSKPIPESKPLPEVKLAPEPKPATTPVPVPVAPAPVTAPAPAPAPVPVPVPSPVPAPAAVPVPAPVPAPVAKPAQKPTTSSSAPALKGAVQDTTPSPKVAPRTNDGSEQKFFPAAPRYSSEQAVLFYNVFSRHYLLAMSLDSASKTQCVNELKNYPTGGFSFNTRMNIIDFFNKQNQSNFGSQLVNEIVLNTQMEKLQFDEFFKTTDNCKLAVTKGEFAYELSNNNFGFKN